MAGLRLLLVFVGAFLLIALGIRSYVRIARRARAAGRLDPGFADSNANSVKVYRFAFSKEGRSADSWLMLLGFVGGMALLIGNMVIR